MKHHSFEQLQIVAEVDQDYPRRTMSRSERLERWADLLDEYPDRCLSTLHETEYQPARVRAAMRADGTAISIAFDDPIFRAAGLENDSYGEAKRFFELRTHRRAIAQGRLLLSFRRDARPIHSRACPERTRHLRSVARDVRWLSPATRYPGNCQRTHPADR